MSREIGPVTNTEAAELRELVRSASIRREKQQYIIEGPHLLQSALEFAKDNLIEIYATESARAEHGALFDRSGKLLRSITQKNAERIADTSTTQGLFGLMQISEAQSEHASIILALDDVQDPGNVGTVVRTAAWFGVYDIITSAATADLYSPKVLRATQGSIFNAQMTVSKDLAADLKLLQAKGYRIIVTMLDESATPLGAFKPSDRMVIVLGSEAHGVSDSVAKLADSSIYIPKLGKGESLNVAISCGIILEQITSSKSQRH
jgi:TrmH family RNA methyltransferase